MSSLKSLGFLLGWLVVLLGGAAGLSFCAVWGLDIAGLSPVWGVPGVGGLLAAVCFGLFLRLKPVPQAARPRSTWRDQVSSRTAQLRHKLAQVASRLRHLWAGMRLLRTQPQTSATATGAASVPSSGVPASMSSVMSSVTPVHSIVVLVSLPPRPQVAPAVSVTTHAPAQEKESARYATNA